MEHQTHKNVPLAKQILQACFFQFVSKKLAGQSKETVQAFVEKMADTCLEEWAAQQHKKS